MTRQLALIHTVRSLVPVFGALTRELAPDVTTTDLVDEALLEEAIAAGEVPRATAERLRRHVAAALEGGADAVLVTCSSMGGVVDELRARNGWPLLRVDEAMVDAALAAGPRLGVVATLGSTLRPTADLVRRRARELYRDETELHVVTRLVDGAFTALKTGDVEAHDAAVRGALRDLLPQVDAIVLAQASMARIADTLEPGEAGGTAILASPRLGVERVVEQLGQIDGPRRID
jgi:Asp/Glu/hydantoin racemase